MDDPDLEFEHRICPFDKTLIQVRIKPVKSPPWTSYIACRDADDAQRILDLLDNPPTAVTAVLP